MKNILLLLMFIPFAGYINGQTCTMYYPETAGKTIVYNSYDAKEKLTGSSSHTVKAVRDIAGGKEADIYVKSEDNKGKTQSEGTITVACKNGVYTIDLKDLMAGMTSAYKDMDIEITSDKMEMPSDLKVGDVLKDGKLTIRLKNPAMNLFSMSITNRKVEAKEKISTPAGEFECYKITYIVSTNQMVKVTSQVTEWYAAGVGLVKSENYSENMKLQSKTILQSIK